MPSINKINYEGTEYDIVGDELTALKEDLSDVRTVTIGENLVNPNVLITGAVQANGAISVAGSFADYATTDFIELEPNTDYILEIFYKPDSAILIDRRLYLLYDQYKEPVSTTFVNTYGNAVTAFNSGASYKFVRASTNANNWIQIEKGTQQTVFKPYEKTVSLNNQIPLTSAMREEVEEIASVEEGKIDEISDAVDDIARMHYSKNMLDESDSVTGAIQSNGTISTAGSFSNYATSNYIRVKRGITYFIGVFSNSGIYSDLYRKLYLLFDNDKNVISGSYVNVTTSAVVIPSTDGYIRVSWSGENKCMVEEGSTHTDYVPYSSAFLLNDTFPLTQTMRREIGDVSSNPIMGKKWAHCGDSFSHYTNKSFESGQFSGKNMTFPRLIADRNEMTLLQDFMLSGRTMAYPADGTFVNALTAPGQSYNYQNIPEDIDYVTIMLGINDCQHIGSGSTGDGEDATGVITLGTIDDTTINTYYGAYNTVLLWLRTNRPFAHVGIVVTNGTTRQDYTEAQIAVAKKWGYPYINLNGDERTPAFIRAYNPNLPQALKDSLLTIQGVNPPDNTHPNWQTHELESTIIEAWLRTL